MSLSRDLHIFTHEFYPHHGGAGVVAEQLAQAACTLGKRVRVWVPRRDLGEIRETNPPFATLPLPVRGSMDWSCRVGHALQVSRYLSRYGFGPGATLHLAEPGSVLAWMYLQLRPNFPHAPRKLITLHGSEILRFSGSPHRRLLFRRLLGRCQKIHLLSHANAALLRARFPQLDPNKLLVLPGAPRPLATSSGRPPLAIPDAGGRLVILSVGRVHPRKGHRHLLQTASQLPEHLQESITLWYAGRIVDPSYQRELESLAARTQIPIHFFGKVSDTDLSRLYMAADVFAMTSRQVGKSIEGFGLVYLEASQAGLPILANDTGGVAEAVVHEQTGLLSDPDKPEQLRHNLARLIQDRALREKLGQQGKRFAGQHSWIDAASQLYS